ncbi:MAG: head-tail connector protein [Muribaculaceae bacterium]|nr:head-tail connector protein [Muribaculaceae bacterium]
MSATKLELLKKHVRADDFSEDDGYLAHLLDAAEEYVVIATRRTVEELTDGNGGEFPAPLKHAVMMLAAHWYNQREAVSGGQMAEVPYTVQALVKPFIKLTV